MKYLIIAAVVIVLVVAALGVVGYRKSKKLYSEFTANTTAKVPFNKADILALTIKNQNAGAKYTITFIEEGTEAFHVVYEDGVKVLYDLRNNEKPYIKFKHLKNDVPFPKVKTWEVARGYYDVEIHIEKEYTE
jgi:hypothetical protein